MSDAARLRRQSVAIVAFIGLSIIGTWPLILHFGTAIPGSGDAYQFYWNLWWVKRALIDLHANPFLTSDVFAPYGASLYFHTLNLLQSAMVIPVALASGLPAAYNMVVFVAFTLTGYGTYLLALYVLEREIGERGDAAPADATQVAAWLAGVMFMFCSYRFVHLLGHLDLLSTEWLPFFVLYLLRARREGGWWNSIACGMFLAAIALTSWYYAAFALVFVVLFVARVIAAADTHWREQLVRIAGVMVVFALLVSPLLFTMLLRGRIEGRTSNPAADVDRFSADLAAFVIPSPLHPLWGRRVAPLYRALDRRGATIESVVFLGYVPLALACVIIATSRARTWTFWIVSTVLFALLAMGPAIHVFGRAGPAPFSLLMPYRWFATLPYADIPRVPSRFVVMAMLSLSLIAAGGARTLLRSADTVRTLAVAALLAALIVFENGIWPTPIADMQVPPLFYQLSREPRTVILEVPIPDDPAVFKQRMLWQTVHGQPVVGGYLSRSLPPLAFDAVPGFAQFKSLTPSIDDVVTYDARELPALSRAILANYGVERVVVERRLMSAAEDDRARLIAEGILGASALRQEDPLTREYVVSGMSVPVRPVVWLDTGWSYLERRDERDASARTFRWRWMGNRGRLGLAAPAAARVRLKLNMRAFQRPRRLSIAVDGREVATVVMAADRVASEISDFDVSAGLHFIELTSLDGADSPGVDPRRLSFALFGVELLTAS